MGKRLQRSGEGKTILVTGAAGGMGYAAAGRLAREGYLVFGLDLRLPEPVEGVMFLEADLTDPGSVARAFEAVAARTEKLDAIVHMAGRYELGSLLELEEEEFLGVWRVNLVSAWRVNRVFRPLLRPGGRILITTSELAPLDPLPFTGIYGITKTALEKYAFSLRMEAQLLGLKVIVLRPGAVDTGLLDVSTRRLEDFCRGTENYKVSAERFRRIVDRVEARKIPPERISELAVRALASRRPRYVYSVNRNPLLRILSALPARLQCAVISGILKGT